MALIIFHGSLEGSVATLFTEDVSPRKSGAIHLTGGGPGRREIFFT